MHNEKKTLSEKNLQRLANPNSKKDIFLFTILSLIVLLLILLMVQVDRQWQKLANLEAKTDAIVTTAKNRSLVVNDPSINQNTDKNNINRDSQNNAFARALTTTKKNNYAQGDWHIKSFGNQLVTITPLVSSDAYASAVQGRVLESLLTRHPDTFEWIGLIAKDWKISEDGLTVNFNLRENVMFSDGVPLTSEDVVFSYDFVMNEAIAAPRSRAYFEKLKSVKAINRYTVEFIFSEPYFEILSIAGGMEILPKHFYEGYLKNAQEFNSSKGLLMGSGAYRLADPKNWTPDIGQVELVRNQNYWGDTKPAFDRLVWKIIQNDTARLTTYRNGDIDDYSARPIEYKNLLADEQIKTKSHNFEYLPPVAGYSYVAWNQQQNGKATRFADKRVRQAMSAVTDVSLIIRDVYLNYAEQAVSPFSPQSKQHNSSIVPQGFQLEKAKKLLQEAGYKVGKNKVLINDKGEPFEFKLTYFQANEDTNKMVLLLRDIYAGVGVKLIPDPQEWPVMLEKLKRSDFEAITLGWTSGIETNIYQIFHSSQIKVDGDNFVGYKNIQLDKIIEQAQKTTDEDARMKLWREAEKIIVEDQPYTFLMRRQALVFIDKRIQNLQMTNLGLNYGFMPMEIYVPTTMQKYH